MIIREFRPEDEEAVWRIALAAWEPVYAGYRAAMGDEIFDFYRKDWRERKKADVVAACRGAGGFASRVMEIDGRVAGFITYLANGDGRSGIIGNNAVDPDFQGRGIAQTLCRFALDDLRRRGVRYVSVLTGGDAAHAPARRVYEKAGFAAALPSVTYHLTLP